MTRMTMQAAGVMASVLTVPLAPLADNGLIAPCRRRRSRDVAHNFD